MYIYFAECRASSDEHMANGGRTNGVITEVPYHIIQTGSSQKWHNHSV